MCRRRHRPVRIAGSGSISNGPTTESPAWRTSFRWPPRAIIISCSLETEACTPGAKTRTPSLASRQPSIEAPGLLRCRILAARCQSRRAEPGIWPCPAQTAGVGDGTTAGSRRCLPPTRSGIPRLLGRRAISPATEGFPGYRRVPHRCPRLLRRAVRPLLPSGD